MHSAGNDIVALDLIDRERSAEDRFFTKIITEKERSLYQQPGISDAGLAVFVWICWSAKEAAYKYLKRHQPALGFAPVRFQIEHMEATDFAEGFYFEKGDLSAEKKYYTGWIAVSGERLPFRIVRDDRIIASACGENFFTAIHEIGSGSAEDQSASVRKFCLEKICGLHPGAGFRIEKHTAGYPSMVNLREQTVPVSFAHHGRYVSYSYPERALAG